MFDLEQKNGISCHGKSSGPGVYCILCGAMWCSLAIIGILEVLLCLTPPISRDALIHHLAIPKLWIRHGGFYETPWNVFSYFPMNIDLLYLVPLLFGNDRLPAFIHLLFGWATGILVYQYLKEQEGRLWGLLGLLVFVSTPVVIRLSVTAYVDLGMTFFTTASVLVYLRWRDGRYADGKWFLLSALFMGLAAGSKYNALISWVFLTVAVCYLYAKDTGTQMQAIRWGLLFSAIALAVVSPWFVKNLILKGNPIYPLMDNLFSWIHVGRETPSYLAAGGAASGGYSVFGTRAILYGEELWQILLLPFRIFFEGRDHSPQHFDGILNPLVVFAIPFAFAGSRKGHRLFFLLFIGFVFFVAAFTADMRIRYILPILPFLTILAVTGIRNITEWLASRGQVALKGVGRSVFLAVAVLLAANLYYLANQFVTIRPLPYLLGAESRDEFLSRQVGSYPAVAYINRTLPDDAVVYLLFLGGRGYYLERDYLYHVSLENHMVKAMVRSSTDIPSLTRFLRSLGSTHLLIRDEMLQRTLEDNFPPETVLDFLEKLAHCLIKVYESDGHSVYRIA